MGGFPHVKVCLSSSVLHAFFSVSRTQQLLDSQWHSPIISQTPLGGVPTNQPSSEQFRRRDNSHLPLFSTIKATTTKTAKIRHFIFSLWAFLLTVAWKVMIESFRNFFWHTLEQKIHFLLLLLLLLLEVAAIISGEWVSSGVDGCGRISQDPSNVTFTAQWLIGHWLQLPLNDLSTSRRWLTGWLAGWQFLSGRSTNDLTRGVRLLACCKTQPAQGSLRMSQLVVPSRLKFESECVVQWVRPGGRARKVPAQVREISDEWTHDGTREGTREGEKNYGGRRGFALLLSGISWLGWWYVSCPLCAIVVESSAYSFVDAIANLVYDRGEMCVLSCRSVNHGLRFSAEIAVVLSRCLSIGRWKRHKPKEKIRM